MPSTREYADFILEQLQAVPGITARRMMGEYILYINGRIFGGIYDDRLLVKITPSSARLMPDAEKGLPYEGARPMLPVTNPDSREFLAELVLSMLDELPELKKKAIK